MRLIITAFLLLGFGIGFSLGSRTLSNYRERASSDPALIRETILCLSELKAIRDFSQLKPKSDTCSKLAEPLKDHPDLTARSLYLSAMALRHQFEDRDDSYEFVFRSTTPYFQEHLQNLITPVVLKKLSPEELSILWDASLSVSFYSANISSNTLSKEKLFLLYDELNERKRLKQNDGEDAYGIAIGYRDWSRANRIRDQWPQAKLPKVPKFQNELPIQELMTTKALLYYEAEADGSFLTRSFQFSKGPQIILVAGCHFAKRAIQDLSEKKELLEIFKRIGFTIGPAKDLDSVEINLAAKTAPEFKIHPVANPWAWWANGIPTDGMPIFYFLLDGKVQSHFYGAKDVVFQFCEGLQRIAVDSPASCRK